MMVSCQDSCLTLVHSAVLNMMVVMDEKAVILIN